MIGSSFPGVLGRVAQGPAGPDPTLATVRGIAHDAVLVGLCIANLSLIGGLFLMLRHEPAPAFSRYSLRKQAGLVLFPTNRRERLTIRLRSISPRFPVATEVAPYLALGLALALPFPIAISGAKLPIAFEFGPLNEAKESEEYLRTLWQVVAASLALSIAMVAFAFEAFVSRGQEHHGGTLTEFARETRLVAAVRLGVTALVVNGLVLLEIGHDAPRGWSAFWAIFLSAATLLAVPFVIGRVLRGLEFGQLLEMRRKRLDHAVDAALRRQLLSQAADVVLRNANERVLLALPRAAGRLGLPFEGAIAAPGFFGFGPLQRIRDYLHDELTEALKVDNRHIVDAVAHVPDRVAREAVQLGALEVARAMWSLYPAMYYAARQERE